MQKILRRVKEQEIVPVERSKMKRQLIRIIEFGNTHKRHAATDIAGLEALLLRLETEFAAIEPSLNILSSIIEHREPSKGHEMRITEDHGAPSVKELRRLIGIANDGFLLGWLVDLQEALAEVSEQVCETSSRLDELKQSLAYGQPKMTETDRRRTALIVRRIIAFNNRSAREKKAFDAVGLGSCANEPDACATEVKKALRLTANFKQGKK